MKERGGKSEEKMKERGGKSEDKQEREKLKEKKRKGPLRKEPPPTAQK
jgi:hypothetical protein